MPVQRFPQAETVSPSAQVEKRFMEWMLRDNARPGTMINELEFARQFGVATTGMREFLNRFHRFGLIEKRPNAGWVSRDSPRASRSNCSRSGRCSNCAPRRPSPRCPDSPLWRQIEAMREEHLSLLREIEPRFHDFSDLDNRFHRLINSAAPNRFIDGFYDIITLIFHYHYQWNKRDERQRNEVAIGEHLAYIDALRGRNAAALRRACRAHLESAKTTLLDSTSQQRPPA